MENNELSNLSGNELFDEEKILATIISLREKSYVENFDLELGKETYKISTVMYQIISEIRVIQANNLGENLVKMLFQRNDFLSASIKLEECMSYIRQYVQEIRNQKLAIEVASSQKVINSNLPMRLDERNQLLDSSFLVLKQMYVICGLFAKKYNDQSMELEDAMTIGSQKMQKRFKHGAKNINKLMKDFADKLETD